MTNLILFGLNHDNYPEVKRWFAEVYKVEQVKAITHEWYQVAKDMKTFFSNVEITKTKPKLWYLIKIIYLIILLRFDETLLEHRQPARQSSQDTARHRQDTMRTHQDERPQKIIKNRVIPQTLSPRHHPFASWWRFCSWIKQCNLDLPLWEVPSPATVSRPQHPWKSIGQPKSLLVPE